MMDEQYRTLPLIAMREDTVLPGCLAHFDAGREETIKAFETAMLEESQVFIIAQRTDADEIPEDEEKIAITQEMMTMFREGSAPF